MNARQALLIAVAAICAACASQPATRSTYLLQLDDDARIAAQAFAAGSLDGRSYLALVRDRAAKAQRYHDDPLWRRAADLGDRDHDGVPDAYDQCDSPRGTPTDERGCPISPTDCPPDQPQCGPDADADRRTRQALNDVALLFNPKCDNSPTPQTPMPLRWGRGQQRLTGGAGFNLAVTKVDNQRPECEFFYEIEVRTEHPGPTITYTNVLFKAAEDLKPTEPGYAVFGLPMPVEIPVSPARDQLRKILDHTAEIKWRVRAVNGANALSPWSPIRAQRAASGGVDG